MNTIFIGQTWQVTQTLSDEQSSTPVVLLAAGIPVELVQLPLPCNEGVFVEVRAFGHQNKVRLAWEDLLSVAEPVATMPKLQAELAALRIWDHYNHGEKTFSHSLSSFREFATMAIAASNSAEKNIDTGWNLTKENFIQAFVARATGVPTK